MDKLHKLKEIFNAAEKDADGFYGKGNQAAGTRLRKKMQQLKVAASDIRKEVTERKTK